MKSASAALIALLDSQTFLMADLLTITLINGTVLRYCSWDTDLTVGGNLYSSSGVQFKRGTVRNVIGIEVDSMDLSLYANTTDQIESISAFTQIRTGVLDAARVKVDRLFMATPGDVSAGTMSVFSGRISGCVVSRSEAQLTVVSDLILMNVQMPRNVYQPSCLHTLYDDDMLALGQTAVGCKLNKASFAVTGSIFAGVTTISTLDTNVSGHPDDYFSLGYLVFTSGPNNGVKRTVKKQTNSICFLTNPLPYLPLNGDTFTIYPGCDHSLNSCTNKFSNVANFRGFPYVPVPETAV